VHCSASLAESPIWIPEREQIAWVDIMDGIVTTACVDGKIVTRVTMDEPVGAIALASNASELVAATPSGLRFVSTKSDIIVAAAEASPTLRMNDGKPDPVGRFVVGTMGIPSPVTGSGTLWSFGGERARPLLRSVTISNGLCWSADGLTLYYIDTPTQRIDAFDYDLDSGDISNRRTLFEIDEHDGAPDGMTIDDQGGLWVALWGGGCIRRYAGKTITEEIPVPTPFVTCPVFVGAELDILIITTAALPFGDDAPDGAGDVYVAKPGTKGLAPNRWSSTTCSPAAK
jgi:sugar lactone lactonase YvrE